MTMKTGKRLLGAVCFLLILALLVNGLTFITRNKNEADLVCPYYDEPNNSLDVVFVGSSHVMCGIYPLELYHEYGIAAYDYTSSALVLPQAYYQAVEALKTQTPKVLVLDISGVAYNDTKVGSLEYVHVQLDNMKWSLNKIAAINDLIEDPGARLEYYFPLLKFHTRWKDLNPADYKKITGDSKGARVSDTVLEGAVPQEIMPKDYVVPMSEYPEVYLRKILDYCRDRGVQVLLLNLPFIAAETSQGKYNAVYEIAEEYGLPYLNLMHHLDDIGFDYSTDLRDTSHCNRSGAEKVTSYVGGYLKENYDLPDRREDAAYASDWDVAYERYASIYS